MQSMSKPACAALAVLATASAWPAPAAAEPTLELYIRGAKEVFQGDPVASSVDAEGRISAGPVLVDLADGFDRPVVTMTEGARGNLYVGTAGGGLMRITKGGVAKSLAPFTGKVVSALARYQGALYAATAPDGEIVTVSDAGKVRPFFQPGAKYVWAMTGNGRGLLVATGAPGRVLKVSAGGKSEVIFDPGETHVRAMIRHKERGVIVGGGQKGIVYQIEGKGAYALYDSDLEEVTAFAIDPKTQDLYAAVVSASDKGALTPTTWVGPVKGDIEDDTSPIKSSEVVRIRKSGQVDTVWTSQHEGAMGLSFDSKSGQLHIATAASVKNKARIYAVHVRDRDRVFLMTRLAPPLATALVGTPDGGLLVGTAPSGRVIRVGPKMRATSTYLSVEQDLERISTMGRLWFDADLPRGTKVALSLRTGNTKTPDDTWSDWSAAVRDPKGANVQVRAGRFAQFRAQLSASARGDAPVIKSMHASLVRMNVPPTLQDVFMLRRGVYMSALPPEGEKERTVTLSKTVIRELTQPTRTSKSRTRARQGQRPGMMTVAWNAKDDNHDQLLYTVRMRALDGPSANDGWRVVQEQSQHAFHSFDSRALPDGRYQFQVLASDRPSNPPDAALQDVADSEAFLIDNAPPSAPKVQVKVQPLFVQIEAQAKDSLSPLDVAEISIDGGPWLMFPAADGLIDAPSERFRLALAKKPRPGVPALSKGAHTVRVRVLDRAGNESTGSARFKL